MKSKPVKRPGRVMFRWKEYMAGYLFALPWIVGFAIFAAYPLLWSFYMTFHNVGMTQKGFTYEWLGLQNYINAFVKDNVFPIELITYVQEMLLIIPIILIFSLFVAIILNQRFPGRTFFRAVFFLPVIFATGPVLLELFTQGAGQLPFVQQYDVEGLIRQFVSPQFADPILNVLNRMVIILWYSGVQILIFIAGFQTISRTVYEAVRIDGASPWQSFWKITLPAMVPFISLNALYTIIDLFTFPLNPVMQHIRSNMFLPTTGIGYANALAWTYFLFIFLLIAIVLLITKRALKNRGETR